MGEGLMPAIVKLGPQLFLVTLSKLGKHNDGQFNLKLAK